MSAHPLDMDGVMPDATAAELDRVLRDAEADVLVLGHTHRAMEISLGDRLVLNPGALLREPADGWERELPTPGTFGVLELPTKRWTVFRARTGQPVEIVRGVEVGLCPTKRRRSRRDSHRHAGPHSPTRSTLHR